MSPLASLQDPLVGNHVHIRARHPDNRVGSRVPLLRIATATLSAPGPILTVEARLFARAAQARVLERQRPTHSGDTGVLSLRGPGHNAPALTISAEAEADLGGSGAQGSGRSRAGRILGPYLARRTR